ncbi:MAG: N-6 DNA methylase [Oscillospiraceae bacterium]|nr:N-6 DNA methylase [Oscillospiraceae bacterium]
MAAKVETYRQMADHATGNLTAQIKDWSKFLMMAGQFYKYSFLDQVMIYTQRPDATACAEFDLWNHRMGRRIRRGSKGIALLRYRDGRVFLRYVFDVADTERRENGRDPMLWQYRDEYENTVTARLEEAFGVPGSNGLAKQLITLAVQFADEHWNDFKDKIMLAVHGSSLDGLDEDNVALRFRSAVTVSLSFLLLARCGFDLDSYFTPEDFECISEFDTRVTILTLGNAVSESANVILRQVERAVKARMAGRSTTPPAPAHQTEERKPLEDTTAAGNGKPAAASVSRPKPEAPPAASEPPQEAPGQLAMPGYSEPTAPAPGPVQARQEAPARPAPAAVNFRITDDDLGIGGPKAKYAANTAAIRVLKAVEAEGRAASPDEQEILSRYVGWGGVPDAFAPDKAEWANEYVELKALLTGDEYASARASTLNAHFTPPIIIRAIYEALGRMGFQSGNILEPSCGVGSFFGCLPESMSASRLYGVELDAISGRIAQQLYPKANIVVRGYEHSAYPKDFFDAAVGNVPFGDYKVSDPGYNKLGFTIHNYFLAKALDQLRPGGVMAFVTSRYTMDSKDSTVRKYLAERADLLGAIRLPNNAFKANAGTDVVADIIFLQKREEPAGELPDWVSVMENQDGYPVNSYFMDNPEMVLGCPGSESTRYGHDYTVYPSPGAGLARQLHEAVTRIHGQYRTAEVAELETEETADEAIPADPAVKNYSYTVVDGAVYYRENSVMVKPKLNATARARVKGMVQLRDCLQELIAAQMEPDAPFEHHQRQLNVLYDGFRTRYGLINSRANRLAFSRDNSYYLLCSLEILDDDGSLERKADIFTKRTIQNRQPVAHVDTAQEALAVSIGERARVDLPYMAQLTGKDEDALVADLSGLVYRDPETEAWQTADEYLSGNVRRKLRQAQRAAEDDPAYRPNVDALVSAQPKDLEASEIEVRLGATWIAPEYVQQFMYETFRTPKSQRENIRVNYVKATAAWFITHKSWISDRDITANTTYGTDRRNAYEILEESLNLRDVRVYDTVTDANGNDRRVLNVEATTLAAQKQQMIRDAFKDWLWQDQERRRTLVRHYNDTMNCIRPREYDGSHIVFHGINPGIRLRPHQLGAIAHVLYGGNTLLAHEVGAGKTFEMIASIMESKYLGLCSKAVMVMPNHLTQQTAAEFLRLYPAANILVTTKRDFETARRKKFCARIATGSWDAVIIGHSQFEKIPVSYERQKRIIDEQISDITFAIGEVKASKGERFTIKQMEKLKKDLQAKLDKLKADWKKDNVIAFEQLGIDMMLVDESDMYKNLFLTTKMRNVAGLSTAEAQKSTDMFTKCRYLDELTHGRGIVMATGTPISNSMTECYTIQRYLQYDRLQEMGMGTFDSWASRFGETVTALELAPEGTGYRARTRFSRFFNLPELMAMFKEVADIKTADQLDLPVPEAEYHTVVCKPTEHQKALVKELSKRAEKVHAGTVDAHKDNMLKITSDGRKLGLDQRIVNPALPDEPSTKVNQCVANILRHWRDGEADKLTQLVFSDISTPTAGKGGFNIYDDIRKKLVAAGMPPEQVAFIHDADSDEQKKTLFAKVRSGQVRVLIGSTAKMGAGTNCQDRLIASHDLDAPWRPRDLTQRAGRIVRQGNMNAKVHIYRYVTESTFDSYLWQTLEAKQKFISQVMTSRTPLRSCEDVDETALSFAEIKALCAGDPRIKERMELDVEVSRLRIMKADYQFKKFRLEDNANCRFPTEIKNTEALIGGIQSDMRTLAEHPHPEDGFIGMKVRGRSYLEREKAGEALMDAIASVTETEPVEIGSYRGFTITAQLNAFGGHRTAFKGAVEYTIDLGDSAIGNIIRVDNSLEKLPEHLEKYRAKLTDLGQQLESAKAEAARPFAMEAELQRKSARLAELDAALNLGGKSGDGAAA